MSPSDDAGSQPYAWLTTTGRRSREPRTVELWFGLAGSTLYFLSGGGEGAHWVQNARTDPAVSVRLGGTGFRGIARAPSEGSDEELVARRLLAAKVPGAGEKAGH